ncbi:MAG: AsnC family transcriptional regulator [Rhodobacter sp.]|jgi:DNA-binding Lrp family transcriptional regulator|nr:AsnC family transcriptional regulator [Rhodobacter sp.]
MDRLDPIDARLLDEFQRDLPLVPQPFAALGAALGLDEAEVIDRLARLKATGAIARVGATVRPNTAGASTLAAVAAPEGRVDEVAAIIGAEPGVNHSYLREDNWNLWFVATAPDAAGLDQSLARIEAQTGLRVLDLRLVRAFNIDLGFRLTGERQPMAQDAGAASIALTDDDRKLLSHLSRGLSLVPRPFAALGADEAATLSRLKALLQARVITRLGVIVRHRTLGWTSNAMVVWDLPEAAIPVAGAALAALPGVTLCYQRRSVPGVWPYALYSMIHGRSRAEALAVLDRARALPALAGAKAKPLFSTRCFKQTGALLSEAA